ncbi:hypothetical protein BDM02DRAFT_3115835 [Thelephora ganbajun]|uniref:Uncharacterized protein n=1 Tax=Thelephora ganbajun TaxID=370292 RepID=A0ACB6ZFI7_THEGA|nr:hypothetical protein BDM02DRAFT_3115835 [Thelephora ganbajun]
MGGETDVWRNAMLQNIQQLYERISRSMEFDGGWELGKQEWYWMVVGNSGNENGIGCMSDVS